MATLNDPTTALALTDNGIDRQAAHEANRKRRNWRSTADITESDSPYAMPDDYDCVVATLSASGCEVDLPASPTTGRAIIFKAMTLNSQTLTIDGNGNNIDGSANTTITTNYDSVEICYDGTEWVVLSDTR